MIQDGPSVNPEQLLARYDETLKQAAASAERTGEALRQIGGEASSPDGLVTVRVNASGATTGLELRAGARGMDPEELARLILRTTQQAQGDVGTKVVETMREFMGEGEGLEFVKSHLPQPVAAEEAPPAPQRRDARADDDYFDNPPDVIS